MHLVMFDIDGTLIKSNKFDDECYLKAAYETLGKKISPNWEEYAHATDSGILKEAIVKYDIKGDSDNIQKEFKRIFINYISEYINNSPNNVCEIKGAAEFVQYLCDRDNIKVAIATGGWEETAKLKLKTAGIDINRCAFASCSDHYKRTEIMKIAESRALQDRFISKTYFGDSTWDKQASKKLNYRFVLVGNNIENEMQINDYQQKEMILELLGF